MKREYYKALISPGFISEKANDSSSKKYWMIQGFLSGVPAEIWRFNISVARREHVHNIGIKLQIEGIKLCM